MLAPKILPLGANWQEVLESEPCAVVFFWAAWSPHDLRFAPIIDRVATDFEDQLSFYSADLDDEALHPFINQGRFVTNPQLTCFRRGAPGETLIGVVDEAKLRAVLTSWLHQ